MSKYCIGMLTLERPVKHNAFKPVLLMLERLRNAGYDHIVIDAPPVLGSADVNLMADAADTVVLATRARTSTTRDLRRAIDQLGSAKVAGTVLVE